jgi:phosphopantothenoylcysteine decarboxylase/phosphopantothenate--cysteine ligase
VKKPTVVLGVTGGIAAYKSADIVSRLRKRGVEVYVVMTKNAAAFVAPLTFETMSNHPVAVDMFKRETPWEVEHIALAKRADLFLIAPATANVIAKYANGIADDMLTTTLLATEAPVLIAPAMNTRMWENAATRENVARLAARGVSFIGPAKGWLAEGMEGYGRMEEPEVVVERAMDLLHPIKDLAGKRVLVSAGPTREAIDPVRYISNHSSGKMGFAIARAARRRGAEVTVVHGPVSVPVPHFVRAVAVTTTQEMHDALAAEFGACDLLIKCAAPADFRPHGAKDQKIKKDGRDDMMLRLEPTVDILSALGAKKTNQIVVGFAAETQNVTAYAQDKLKRKNLDMIVANDVTQPGAGFGVDTNIVTVFRGDGMSKHYPQASKDAVADFVLDEAVTLLRP